MQIDNSKTLTDRVIQGIRDVVGPGSVALHEPSFNGNEWLYLKECLDSSYVSSVGKFVNQFEEELKKFTGAKYAISVVNGTAALQIALKLAKVAANDEVLIPTLTFVATANAVTYCNALPHFVDCEERTLGIDTSKLRDYLSKNSFQESGQCINKKTGRVIRALVPMHTFGHPSDIDGLVSISEDFNIALVEDAAESIGSFYKGQHTGTFGLLGALSFNGNKTITTGGGGAILTNNETLAEHARHLTTTAKIPHAWEYRHSEIGFNYRLPNINAALGCAQMEQLPKILSLKRKLYLKYQEVFEKISGIELLREPVNSKSNYWLQTLILDEDKRNHLDLILKDTNQSGLMTRPIWIPLNELQHFKNLPMMDLENSRKLSKRVINIPSSPGLLHGTSF